MFRCSLRTLPLPPGEGRGEGDSPMRQTLSLYPRPKGEGFCLRWRSLILAFLLTSACLLSSAPTAARAADPPFWGTVWIDPDIIRPTDYSAYQTMSYAGVAPRFVFDRRDNFFSTKSMHIFDATYADDLPIEVQVNAADFTHTTAQAYALSYAEMVGQLPTSLRAAVETLCIHAGGALPFGGGNDSILIHVDVEPTTVPFLEEILFHEATHTSYDATHNTAPGWLAAQDADPNFISLYARDNPSREDVAETLLMWYALRHRSDRLDATTINATNAAIPNRLAYFDTLPFNHADPHLDGDFNYDGRVDAADYVLWRKTDGTQPGYNAWRTHFSENAGDPISATSASVSPTAVPEPASALLFFPAAIALNSLSLRERAGERVPCRYRHGFATLRPSH
jgi:hypothetical protein